MQHSVALYLYKVIIYTMSHLPLVLFGCLPKNIQKLEIGYALFCFYNYSSFKFIWWFWSLALDKTLINCATQKYLEGYIKHFALWYGPVFLQFWYTWFNVCVNTCKWWSTNYHEHTMQVATSTSVYGL